MMKVGKQKDIYNIKNQISLKNKLLNLEDQRVLPYKAPLTGSFTYYPFAFLNPMCAYKTFFLLQIIILSVCCYLLLDKFSVSTLFPILFSISPPVVGALLQGQQSIIITFITMMSIILYDKKRNFLSGILISLILIKPNLLPIIIFILVIIKNRSFIYGLITGGLGILFTNIFFYGTSFVKDYLNFLVLTETPYFGAHKGASHTIKIILETIDSLLKINTSKLILPISLLLISIVALVLYIKKGKINMNFKEKIGLSIILGIPLGLHINTYDLSLLIIPLAILSNHISSKISFLWKLIFILLFTIYTLFNFTIIPILTLISLFIIFVLTFSYIKRTEGF